MEEIDKKDKNENSLIPVSIVGTEKILSQMKKSMCKINSKEIECAGFFCKYPYPSQSKFLPVLITINSLLNKQHILNKKSISIKLYGETNFREIEIDNSRKILEYNDSDTTIIEIDPNKDNINLDNFLEVDENIKKIGLDKNFSKLSIYILNYPKGNNTEVSYGILSEIKDNKIYHNCSTEKFYPCSPILNLNNFKVIGIQSSPPSDSKLYKGILLKFPMKIPVDIFKNKVKKVIAIKTSKNRNNKIKIKLNNSNKSTVRDNSKKNNSYSLSSQKNKLKTARTFQDKLNLINNEMTIKYIIKEDKKIQIFGGDFVKRNKGKCKIMINNKEQELHQYLDASNISKEKTIEIKLVETKTITDMSKMFSNCIWLYSLPDISKWNTSLVTNMSFMFCCCFSLSYYEGISKWDISNVTNLSYMFWGCSTFKSIPDISNWNTSNVIDMSYMFNRCLLLSHLPDISKWNTENVLHMEYMFNKCTKLTTLPDLSKWDIKNVINFKGIFSGCKNLIEIPYKFKNN